MKKLYFLFFLLVLTGIFPEQGNAGQDSFFSNQPSFSVIIDKKDASSAEAKDGFIHVKVEGGEAPYTFNCFSPYSQPSKSTGQSLILKNLKPGNYLLVIQDKSGKAETREIKIEVQ